MASSPSEAIKARLSVSDLLEAEGYPVGRRGKLRCPLHDGDNTPSFQVYPGGRGWYCFGCGQGGDVINLAMALWGLTFREAVRELDRRFSLGLSREAPRGRQEALDAWKRRDARQSASRQRERDWDAWARANATVRAGPGEDPWPWVAAVIQRDRLDHRLSERR